MRLEHNPVVICPCPWERGRCNGELILKDGQRLPDGVEATILQRADLRTGDTFAYVTCALYPGHGGQHTFGNLREKDKHLFGGRVVLAQVGQSNSWANICPECQTRYVVNGASVTEAQVERAEASNAARALSIPG